MKNEKIKTVYFENKKIAENVIECDNFFKRLVGLLTSKSEDKSILIVPCNQVHTFGMKYSIDVIFISNDNTVLHIEKSMAPGKMSKYIKGAKKVLELKSGACNCFGLDINKKIEIK